MLIASHEAEDLVEERRAAERQGGGLSHGRRTSLFMVIGLLLIGVPIAVSLG